ncbi:MAG TPA: D-sedoheptulose 7-phosphate isomerase [Bacteroidia bacterium]|nr:D-sedoheptulose 7-phosphate isomerase [Bacteroidia bacterium]HRU68075.1 D-sedoheptulose 7-phosphate isomerase [Bacteroidia bacterium]
MEKVRNILLEAKKSLNELIANDEMLHRIENSASLMSEAIRKGKKIISCGNGGSMSDAMHFAEELTGRFRADRKALPAIAISDPAHLTCVANDYGYENVFARFIEAIGNEGDILLAISTSGHSPNILKAIAAARFKGMKIIGLTGKDGGKMSALCDIEVRAPYSPYSDRTQEIHIKIIHILIQLIEEKLSVE